MTGPESVPELVHLVLTPEQRNLVRRLSGQDVEVIELAADGPAGGGAHLKLRWRLSAASGIPRQVWQVPEP